MVVCWDFCLYFLDVGTMFWQSGLPIRNLRIPHSSIIWYCKTFLQWNPKGLEHFSIQDRYVPLDLKKCCMVMYHMYLWCKSQAKSMCSIYSALILSSTCFQFPLCPSLIFIYFYFFQWSINILCTYIFDGWV